MKNTKFSLYRMWDLRIFTHPQPLRGGESNTQSGFQRKLPLLGGVRGGFKKRIPFAYLYTCIALLLTSCGDDFLKEGDDPASAFFKVHGGGYNQQGADLLELPNGYLMLGTSSTLTDGEENQTYLVEADAEGDRIRSKIIPTFVLGATEQASKIIPSNDGGYFFCGTVSQEDGRTNALVAKLNENYEEIWIQSYGNNETDESAVSIQQTGDGSIWVLGTTTAIDPLKAEGLSSNVIDSSDILLFKLNDSGLNAPEPVWEKRYGYTGVDKGADLMDMGNGSLLILGTTDYPENGATDKDVILIMVNEDGNVFDTRTYGSSGVDEIPSQMTQTVDGNTLAITGTFDDALKSPLFLTVNLANLEAIEGPLPINIETGLDAYGHDIQARPSGNGQFIITGTGEDDAKDILVIEVDPEGNMVNEEGDPSGPKFFGDQGDDLGANVLLQGDEIVIIATLQYLNNTMMSLIKTQAHRDL